jgi:DNA repair protein RecO (recombination protein O)
MRSVSTEGIILSKQDLGEHDSVITIFSPQLGKIRATAKGVRKPNSKLAGHLEPLNVCTLLLHHSSRGHTIIQSQASKTFRLIRENLNKSIQAMLVLEIFQATTQHHEQSEELFTLIIETLDMICHSNNNDLILESFKIKFMRIIGIMPEMERCAACRARWRKESQILLTNDNRLICQRCLGNQRPKMKIAFNVIKLASYACNSHYREIRRIKATPAEKQCFKTIANTFLHLYLDRAIMSERILLDLWTSPQLAGASSLI